MNARKIGLALSLALALNGCHLLVPVPDDGSPEPRRSEAVTPAPSSSQDVPATLAPSLPQASPRGGAPSPSIEIPPPID